jgi:uncharacterized tellurite resistance protein B-like protein
MNIFSLPAKVRKELEPVLQGDEPTVIVRANGSLDGTPGESYVIALRNMLFIFSRVMGVYDYISLPLSFSDISNLATTKDTHDLFLKLTTKGTTYSLKFPCYQEKDLEIIVNQWADTTQSTPPALPTAIIQDTGLLSPFEIALSALMFAAASDLDIDATEEAYIKHLAGEHTGSFETAIQYYDSHSLDEVIALLTTLDEQQKLCALANVIELCMADGVLHSSEQDLIKRYATSMNIPAQRSDAVKDILLIKNQTSVFGT